MIRIVFGVAIAALVFAAVPGRSQAAPIAPLAAGVIAGSSKVTPVYYYYHRHYHHHWRYYHHRHIYHHWRYYHHRHSLLPLPSLLARTLGPLTLLVDQTFWIVIRRERPCGFSSEGG
jgi:hypothetical protein